ncbi:restriction endonuclease subunit S [Roseateles sp.]|uniref:restriction endonuclease subunit S n=1 Tax=Roseateles sp. TaxID=1971397 RepID=UPI003BAA2AE3
MIDAKFFRLADVVGVQAGYPFRGSVEPADTGDAIALQMKDVDPDSGVDWAGALRTHLPGRKSPAWLSPGDLLFVAKGARFYAVQVDAPPMPAVCGPAFFHLRVHPGAAIEPAFLAWQINQPPIQRLLMQGAEGSGQLSIRRPVLEALPLAVPSLAQQRHIVALDAAARSERAALRRLIENREQQLHALAEALAMASARNSTPANS